MESSSVAVFNDDSKSKIVSEFLFRTCRPLQSNVITHQIMAAALCSGLPKHPSDNDQVDFVQLPTGSVAEFYIEPMLSCVGDVDIMRHRSDGLAVPRGYPPPTRLPAEFRGSVEVNEIIDSEYPRYVYLLLSYLLTECDDDGKYRADRQYDKRRFVTYDLRDHGSTRVEIHGPARTLRNTGEGWSFDFVSCARCLSWPPQAAGWPTRHRRLHGWPDAATVDRVVSNGCDAVRVAHRLCRQDELTGQTQWRLSFSRAEIILINSWVPVQQIVYHMLRFFVKTERLSDITDSTGTEMLSNYHLKTLTLWACESKPNSWWTDDRKS